MARLYKLKSKKRSHEPIQCKECGSHNTKRMERNFLEKLISAFTSGKHAHQKWFCKACNTTTYRSLIETEKGNHRLANEGKQF